MPIREIVRDPGVCDGRWRIDGTLIFVADLQRDYRRQQNGMRAPYKGMGLSDGEIDTALAFAFPAVVARELRLETAGIKTRCECGEWRQTFVEHPDYETDACICGRALRVQVDLDADIWHGDQPAKAKEELA